MHLWLFNKCNNITYILDTLLGGTLSLFASSMKIFQKQTHCKQVFVCRSNSQPRMNRCFWTSQLNDSMTHSKRHMSPPTGVVMKPSEWVILKPLNALTDNNQVEAIMKSAWGNILCTVPECLFSYWNYWILFKKIPRAMVIALNMCCKLTHPQAMQDVDEFIS